MMKLPGSCFLAVLVLFAAAESARPDDYTVTAPPAELKLPAFYKKYVNANGYPVVSSAKVSDYALKEAAYLINLMLAERPDVRKAMVASGSRMIVMAYNEFTTDIPEHSKMKPKDFWDARARGLGGSRTDPVCSCAEENVLGYVGDHYDTESIVIHEFAHNIHLRGLVNVDPTFDGRLKKAYKKAMAEGLWKNKYSSTNHAEYWAEGVQSWFDNNRPPDHDHNHVDTRKELKEYDPRLAKLCEEVFGNTKLTYTKPATRLRGHLAGYDPKQAPTFRWPKRLDAVRAEIKRKARNRGKPNEKPERSDYDEPGALSAVPPGSWPQFRGPHSSGVSISEAKLPVAVGPKQNLLWKKTLAKGHSSPVIVGNRLFLTALREGKLLTMALAADSGDLLWERESKYTKLEPVHRIGSPATSSVVTDGEVVVSFFGSSGLNCFSLDGKLLWQRPMGPFDNQFGATSSPMLYGGLIVTVQDHDTGSYLAALDKKTGDEVWRTERPNFRRNYNSPVIWNADGKPQVVVAGTAHVMGYNARTGKLVWTVRGLCRVVSNTPVVGDDGNLYVASTGGGSTPAQPSFAQLLAKADKNKNGALDKGELPNSPIKSFFDQFDRDRSKTLDETEYESIREIFSLAQSVALCVKPGGTGDVTKSHVLWTNTRGIPRNSSPLYYKGRLYMAKDGGVLSVLDAKTGKTVTQMRLAGSGKYFSSPVAGDGKLYILDDRGTLSVLSLNADHDQLHTADFNEPVYATPAIAGGRLYIRTVGTLYCFGDK